MHPNRFSEPMVRLAQIVHLSCVEPNTFSKLTETSLHLTHITYEFHQVRPKRLPSLLHVRFKPCTYLASRKTLSTNRLKRASPWPTSPRVRSSTSKTILCTCYIQRKLFTYLASRLTLSPNGLKRASTSPTSPRSTIRSIQTNF